jgi:peptide deformylase
MLQIIYAPNPVFKQKAQAVVQISEEIKEVANLMLDTMYGERALGLASNMVGVKWQIVVLDLRENDVKHPYVMINPEIIERSSETISYEEASISFPGIIATIERSSWIKVKYLDLGNKEHILEADGLLSRVIQHEVDYLNGVVFLDYLSKMKRDFLIKKMEKYIKNNPPHVHGAHCHH